MVFISEWETGIIYNYYGDEDINPYNSAKKDIAENGWEIVKEVSLKDGDLIIWIKK